MNWRRGLFRMWTVVSLAWVVAVGGYVAIDRIQESRKPTAAEFFGWDETEMHRSDPCKGPDAPAWCVNRKFVEFQHSQAWRPTGVDYAAIAVLPPLVLFIFGIAAFWAVNGFNRKP